MKKRLLSALIVLALLLGMAPGYALADGGTGDFIVPIEQQTEVPEGWVGIYDYWDLVGIENDMSGKYILMADLVLSPWSRAIGGKTRTDGQDIPFTGVFDGNGHSINIQIGYYAAQGEYTNTGLFTYLDGGEVRNLKLTGRIMVVCPSSSGGMYGDTCLGSVAAWICNGASVTNCVTDVDISSNETANSYERMDISRAGGVIGELGEGCSISYCRNMGSVDVWSYAGGIVGCVATYQTKTSEIFACLNEGYVASQQAAGGILGHAYSALSGDEQLLISSCANTGTVYASGSAYAGGIAGFIRNSYDNDPRISDCLNSGEISAASAKYAGGILGIGDVDISRCINTGSVTAPIRGAIAGSLSSSPTYSTTVTGSAVDCYYLNTIPYSVGSSYAVGTALTPEQMKSLPSFPALDFPTLWTLDDEPRESPYPTPLLGVGFENTYVSTYTENTGEAIGANDRFVWIMGNSGPGSMAGCMATAYKAAHLDGVNAVWGGISYLNSCMNLDFSIDNDFDVIVSDIFTIAASPDDFSAMVNDAFLKNFSEVVSKFSFAYDAATSEFIQNGLRQLANMDNIFSANAKSVITGIKNAMSSKILDSTIPDGLSITGTILDFSVSVGETWDSIDKNIDKFVLANCYVDAVYRYGDVLMDTALASTSLSSDTLTSAYMRSAIYNFVNEMKSYAETNYLALYGQCLGELEKMAAPTANAIIELLYLDLADTNPVLAGIKNGVKLGVIAADGATNMDDIYAFGKLLDMAGYMAECMFNVIMQYQDDYAADPTYENAVKLNSATDLYLSLQITACDYGIRYCTAIASAPLSRIFNKNYDDIATSVQMLSMKAYLQELRAKGKFVYVDPDGSISGFIASCPVTVVVEDLSGNELARLSTGSKSCAAGYEPLCFLMGEDMASKAGFYDPSRHILRIEGDGSGTMDLILYNAEAGRVTEYASYTDLPVSKGTVYVPGDDGTVIRDGRTVYEADEYVEVDHPFTDVSGHWAEPYIGEAYNKGYFAGMTATTFVPGGQVTRGQFVTVLARFAGVDMSKYTKQVFDDVPANAWYAPAVQWASENGIANGTGAGKFSPGAQITRQDMATILLRYVKFAGLEIDQSGEIKDFTDEAGIAAYALEAVEVLSRAGVINGRTDGSFDPRASATRAEAATIFCRFANAVS